MNKPGQQPNQWDEYADLYDQGIGADGDDLHQKLIDPLIFSFLGDYSEKAILDLGCGNGYLTNKLSGKAEQVIGADYSKDLLEKARKNVTSDNVTFVAVDATKPFPFDDQMFDYVLVNMVAQYLPQLDTLAKETTRILKKDGHLIIIIDHPGHSLFLRAQALAGKPDKKFIDLDSYFTRNLRKKHSLWNKAILSYYHRPVADYINPFVNNFHLSKIEEVSDDEEVPRILGLDWIKT